MIRKVLVSTKPLVAIGGITLENARSVIEAGADAVAVISDLLLAPDVAARARQFAAQRAVRERHFVTVIDL